MSTRTAEVVACGVLVLSPGLVISEHVYDQPHMHVDSGALEPTTINTMFASGGANTSARVVSNFRIPFEQG